MRLLLLLLLLSLLLLILLLLLFFFLSPTGTNLVGLKINWSHSVDAEWHVWNGSHSMGGRKVPANDVALPRCIVTEIL